MSKCYGGYPCCKTLNCTHLKLRTTALATEKRFPTTLATRKVFSSANSGLYFAVRNNRTKKAKRRVYKGVFMSADEVISHFPNFLEQSPKSKLPVYHCVNTPAFSGILENSLRVFNETFETISQVLLSNTFRYMYFIIIYTNNRNASPKIILQKRKI